MDLALGLWLSKLLINKKFTIKCRTLSNKNKKFGNNKIKFTDDFEKLKSLDTIFLAIPSQSIRNNLNLLKKVEGKKFIFVICSRGLKKTVIN